MCLAGVERGGIAVHYSVIISKLTTQVKNLSQELALLSAHVDRIDGT